MHRDRHGKRMSVFSLADSRSSSLRSDSRTGVTIEVWRPTGQYCSLHHHRRTDLMDTAGIQIVRHIADIRDCQLQVSYAHHMTLPRRNPVKETTADKAALRG